MNSLVKAELYRLVSRRLLIVLLVGMAALAALVTAVSADAVRPLNEQDYSSAQHAVDSERQFWAEECVTGSTEWTEVCRDWEDPVLENFLRDPISFGTYTEGSVNSSVPIMLMAAAILAASLVGGEFSSGNIGTQLLFTPGRVAVFSSKVVAAALGGLLVALVHLGTTLALSAIMFLSLRGADDMTAQVDLATALGRAAVLAFLISVMAAAIAMAVGSTLITAGIFAVVLLGSWMLYDMIPPLSMMHLLLPSNILLAMIAGIHEIYDYTAPGFENGPLPTFVIHYDWALAYSVIGTALICLFSAWWFRRRDIAG